MRALTGILLLARFRAEGFSYFTVTPLGFMNSLAPLLAIGVVAGFRPLISGSFHAVLLHMLTSLVALLAPAVISHFLARIWGRDVIWLRYAVAFNWCQSAITLLTVIAILVTASGGKPGGMDMFVAVVGGILIYWLGLCWFMAWRGLEISRGKAVLAVLATNFGTGLLVLGPQMLALGTQ